MQNDPIGTAVVSWQDSTGHPHMRVFSTDGYTITERGWEGGAWFDGSFTAPGDAVSAACWVGLEGLSIRVFCTFEDVTTEWCIDQAGSGGSWYKGNYTPS